MDDATPPNVSGLRAFLVDHAATAADAELVQAHLKTVDDLIARLAETERLLSAAEAQSKRFGEALDAHDGYSFATPATPPEGLTDDWLIEQLERTMAVCGPSDLPRIMRAFSFRVLHNFGDYAGMRRAALENFERIKAARAAPAGPFDLPDTEPACWCHKCRAGLPMTRMILCPTCGNKRCPKAADHDLACTDSNLPGQPGSAYPLPSNPSAPTN